jgi:adenosine deaminase
MRPATLLRLAQERGLESIDISLDAFRNRLTLSAPLCDLNAVLAQFSLFQKVLDRSEVLEQVAFEALEDCYLEGTRRVEFRYSPTFVSEYGGLSWIDSLHAFQRGLAKGVQKYPQMQVGLICIASRDYGVDEVDRVIEFFLEQFNAFIGVDLAGAENNFPCRLFEASFKKARSRGAKITVHAGEGTGPENIWEAIELLGAKRIGHGVASIQDPLLVKYLETKKICLEVCPTSNWLTGTVSHFQTHPLPQLLRAGVPVSINTDDPGIFGVSLPHELAICRHQMNLTSAELEACQKNAQTFSFLTD